MPARRKHGTAMAVSVPKTGRSVLKQTTDVTSESADAPNIGSTSDSFTLFRIWFRTFFVCGERFLKPSSARSFQVLEISFNVGELLIASLTVCFESSFE